MKRMNKNFLGIFEKLWDAMIGNIKKIPWILGQYAFLFILIFILLDILFGGFLFYHYVFSVKNAEPQITSVPAKFKNDVYQSVLNSWQNREESLNSASAINYADPFK